MEKIFHFVYVQPLHRIVLLMFLAAALWGYLGKKEQGRLRWRVLNGAAFAAACAVIFYMTVCVREAGAAEVVLTPFQSLREAKLQPELYRTMLMNVLLFFPLGLTLPFVLSKGKASVIVTVAAALLFSGGIEYLQYRYGLGRCETDDVIMNTLGALTGCGAYWISCRQWNRDFLEKLQKMSFFHGP